MDHVDDNVVLWSYRRHCRSCIGGGGVHTGHPHIHVGVAPGATEAADAPWMSALAPPRPHMPPLTPTSSLYCPVCPFFSPFSPPSAQGPGEAPVQVAPRRRRRSGKDHLRASPPHRRVREAVRGSTIVLSCAIMCYHWRGDVHFHALECTPSHTILYPRPPTLTTTLTL